MKRIEVHTGSGEYNVYIGHTILGECLDRDRISRADNAAVVVSRRVYDLHRDYIDNTILAISGTTLFLMEDGEENKSYRYAEEFLNGFIVRGLSRHSMVIGVGGGVVGDFAGYLAALYMRGIPVIHVPTTLLSMVDSSVGGKVAVNLQRGKNIAGAFHQPLSVIADLRFLSTLPDNEFRNGLSEILKHGVIGDRPTLDILEHENFDSLRGGSRLEDLVACSVAFKAGVVEKDEREGGIRAILNFGHTVGHAMESLFSYRDISHGEAVAAGMVVETELSVASGLLSREDAMEILSLVEAYGLVSRRCKLSVPEVMEHMQFDKKNSGGQVRFVLLKALCDPVYDMTVDEGILNRTLAKYFGEDTAGGESL